MYRTGPAAALLIGLALALASCGGGGSSTAASSSSPTAGGRPLARSTGQRTTAQGGAGAKATSSEDSCQSGLGDFLDRMNDLRQSLLAGLSYAEYVVRVRAIRDAYEAIPVKRLGVGCLAGAAGEAEDAFNQYLRAANVWGECAATAGCAASEIEARLQHRWKIAAKSLSAAQRS